MNRRKKIIAFVFLVLNAYGQACTYELYGKYVSNIEY